MDNKRQVEGKVEKDGKIKNTKKSARLLRTLITPRQNKFLEVMRNAGYVESEVVRQALDRHYQFLVETGQILPIPMLPE